MSISLRYINCGIIVAMSKTVKKAFVSSIPVMSGYLVLGMGFGIILKSKGYGFLWALAMSGCIYAGSLQYVGINLLAGGASLISVAFTSLMVNARHLFYGISMIEKYRDAGKKKPYMIFALTDETYSLVCEDRPDIEPENYHTYCFFVSLFDQLYWVTGSVAGSLLGNIIPFDTTGIDFALTELFITVFVKQWTDTKDHRPALTGVGASILCLVIFGPEYFLIPSMLIITAVLCFMRKHGKEDADGTD